MLDGFYIKKNIDVNHFFPNIIPVRIIVSLKAVQRDVHFVQGKKGNCYSGRKRTTEQEFPDKSTKFFFAYIYNLG